MNKLAIFAIAMLMPVGAAAQKGFKPPVNKSKVSNSGKGNGKRGSSSQSTQKSQRQFDPVIQNLLDNMVYVEGGSFMMGSNDSDAYNREKPVHRESVESFNIGKYEVTQKEWETIMGYNPSFFKGDNLPVENVSWEECQEFIRKLNEITDRTFRLPTEAEWEYAARGGNRSRGYKFSGSNDINRVGWHEGNSQRKTHSVGLKEPNELGLYDMSGNVSEWTSDRFTSNYGSNPWVYFANRGSSWGDEARKCRVTSRSGWADSAHDSHHGLRLVLEFMKLIPIKR